MNIITRRSFLTASAMGALGSLGHVPGFMQSALGANPTHPWNGNKLLFIFLRGGNDSVNTLIPSMDSAYNQTNRPTCYVPPPSGGVTSSGVCTPDADPSRGIDAGNGFATLHPRLKELCPIINAGEMAMLHRVGYPDQSRSHFDSEVYWENGMPGNDQTENGMFYRAVTETGWHQTQALPAITMQSNLPVSVRGKIPMPNIRRPDRYDLLGSGSGLSQKEIEAISRMYSLQHAQKKNRDLVRQTGERFVNSIDRIRAINFRSNGLDDDDNKISGSPFLDETAGNAHLFPTSSRTDDGGFDSYRAYNFFTGLKNSCQLLQHTDAIISGTELGGFDTHNDQGGATGSHADLMGMLSWGIHAARKYMSHAEVDIWRKTTIVTLSEFGRTSKENGSAGTDHAEAGVMMVASGSPGFNGGLLQCDASSWVTGEQGAMFEENERYLSRRYDYRSVFGNIMRGHLGASEEQLARIIPGYGNPAEALLNGGSSIDGVPILGEPGLFT